ncbi:MAG: nucleoside deaminase [Steroidobacteraceae bacterium]
MRSHENLLDEAVQLALRNRAQGGRPFGAVIARDGEVVATGVNDTVRTHDFTAHAEMEAIRAACRRLDKPDLAGCTVYASGHPCPMCLCALAMAGAEAVYYAFSNEDAAAYGFASTGAYASTRLPLEPPPLPLRQLALGRSARDLDAP